MATIRKPTQSEFNQSQAQETTRAVVREARDVTSAVGGGLKDTLIMILLFPMLLLGLWHGPFVLLGGDIVEGIARIAMGGAALYVLNNRLRRKRAAGREKQLGRDMASEPIPNRANNSAQSKQPHSRPESQSNLAPSRSLAPSAVRYSREALVSKLIWSSIAAFCFGYLSFSEFGPMFVLCLFFAFRAVVLLLNVISPSVCLKLSESGVESSDLIGISTEMRWQDVASISHSEQHFLKQHLSLRYGSRKFV